MTGSSAPIAGILFNNLRGSGREVRIHLGRAGLELETETGNPVGIWPYSAIQRSDNGMAPGLELRLGQDQASTLQIFDEAGTAAILTRVPKAKRSLIGRMMNDLLFSSDRHSSVLQRCMFAVVAPAGFGIWYLWKLVSGD